MAKWTDEEEKIMREKYPNTDNYTLSKVLNRNISSIENKAARMGLKKAGEAEWEEDAEAGGFENPFTLVSREEAAQLDGLELLRHTWSLVTMYERELENPGLTKPERHKLMGALSNFLVTINKIMEDLGSPREDVEPDKEEKLEAFLKYVGSRLESRRFRGFRGTLYAVPKRRRNEK